jgi:ketosteroid isomerase-like protein
MSQENVEIVRRWIEALNRRDVATMSALWRSDGEVDWSLARGPLKGVYRGRSEYESLWNEFFSMFEKSEVGRTASRRRAPKSWSCRTPPTFGGARGSN